MTNCTQESFQFPVLKRRIVEANFSRAVGEFNIRKLQIKDKHGLSRTVYNAKVNIYRELAQPILLGIEDKKLSVFGAVAGIVGIAKNT